jgi:hypothetical protein
VLLKSLADEVSGQNDFRLDGRPFVYSLGWEYEEKLIAHAELNLLLGWAPLDQVVLGAMCTKARASWASTHGSLASSSRFRHGEVASDFIVSSRPRKHANVAE